MLYGTLHYELKAIVKMLKGDAEAEKSQTRWAVCSVSLSCGQHCRVLFCSGKLCKVTYFTTVVYCSSKGFQGRGCLLGREMEDAREWFRGRLILGDKYVRRRTTRVKSLIDGSFNLHFNWVSDKVITFNYIITCFPFFTLLHMLWNNSHSLSLCCCPQCKLKRMVHSVWKIWPLAPTPSALIRSSCFSSLSLWRSHPAPLSCPTLLQQGEAWTGWFFLCNIH